MYQRYKVAGIFRSDGEPGWTWSWHLQHPLLIQVDRSNHATHCKLKKLGVAFKFLLSARETSETAKIKWWVCLSLELFGPTCAVLCSCSIQCRKADVSRWNQVLVLSSISEGEVIHVTWGKPGQSPAQSGLRMAWKVWEIGLIWLHSPLYHGWVWVVRFWQCIFKYLKARICKFWGGVLPLVNNARTFSPA